MSKVCVINYGAYDKNKFLVSDFGNLRVIDCSVVKSRPGIFLRSKIRKYTSGYTCFDKFGVADCIVCPDEKGLFKKDIAFLVKKYCELYGIYPENSEIAVYGRVSNDAIKSLSEAFLMVWLYGLSAGDLHNAFEVRSKNKVRTCLSVYADESFDVPDSGVIFNLTDKNIPAVNNVEVFAEGLSYADSVCRNEAVRLSGIPYEVISFIK